VGVGLIAEVTDGGTGLVAVGVGDTNTNCSVTVGMGSSASRLDELRADKMNAPQTVAATMRLMNRPRATLYKLRIVQACASCRISSNGRMKVKVDPTPISLSTQIRPP
jgi:hypothetical protein